MKDWIVFHVKRVPEEELMWIKVFKDGPSKICRRQSVKNLKWYDMVYPSRPYHFKFFKGYLPQILLCPFLNTLTQLLLKTTTLLTISPSNSASMPIFTPINHWAIQVWRNVIDIISNLSWFSGVLTCCERSN